MFKVHVFFHHFRRIPVSGIMGTVTLLTVLLSTSVAVAQHRQYKPDLRRSFRVFEVDANGMSLLGTGESAVFDPRNRLAVVFNKDALEKYLHGFHELQVKSVVDDRDVKAEARLERLQTLLEETKPEDVRGVKYRVKLADGKDCCYKHLRAENVAYDSGALMAVEFVPEDFFGLPERIMDGVRIEFSVGGDDIDVLPIPYTRMLTASSSLLDRVHVDLEYTRPGAPRQLTPLKDMNTVSFFDVNQPLNFYVQGNIRVVKEVHQVDGSWARPEKDQQPTCMNDGLEKLCSDQLLEAGKRYRYRFVRPYRSAPDEADVEKDIITPRQVVVDDYGSFVFIPVSGLKLSDKVQLPLVVPFTNRPETEGTDLQFGPGLSFPILYMNPRPRGAATTGVRNVRAKLGFTVAALRQSEGLEGDQYGVYAGPWVSLFDFLQLGMAWRLDEASGKPMTYLGFSLADLVPLVWNK